MTSYLAGVTLPYRQQKGKNVTQNKIDGEGSQKQGLRKCRVRKEAALPGDWPSGFLG